MTSHLYTPDNERRRLLRALTAIAVSALAWPVRAQTFPVARPELLARRSS